MKPIPPCEYRRHVEAVLAASERRRLTIRQRRMAQAFAVLAAVLAAGLLGLSALAWLFWRAFIR